MGDKSVRLIILGDNKDAKTKIAEIDAEAERLKAENPELSIGIDTAAAQAKLAVLRAEIKGATDDTNNFKQKLDEVDFAKIGKGAAWFAGIAAAAGPAAESVAVLGAGIAAVGAVGISAGLGLGIFGVVAKGVFTDYKTQISAVSTAQTDMLEGIGGAKMQTDMAAMDKATKGLSGNIQEFVFAAGNAKAGWNDFVHNAADGVAKTLVPALDLVPLGLQKLEAFLPGVETAVSGMISGIGNSLKNGELGKFLDAMSKESGTGITLIANALGHLADMGMKAVVALLPLGNTVLKDIDGYLSRADAGTNSGLQKFLNWVSTNGPGIMTMLKNLGESIVNISKAFVGMGALDMGTFEAIANVLKIVSSNPIGADALVGLLVLLKIGQAVGPLVKLAEAMRALAEAEVLAELAAWALDAVPLIALIVGIGIAIAAIIIGIVELIKHWHDVAQIGVAVWGGIETAAKAFAGWIAGAFKTVISGLSGDWKSFSNDVSGAFNAVKNVISGVINWIHTNWHNIFAFLVDPVGSAVQMIFKYWNTIETAFDSARHAIAATVMGLGHDIESAWDSAIKWVENAVASLGKTIESDWDSFRHGIAAIVDAIPGDIRSAWNTIISDTASFLASIWAKIQTAWNNIKNAFSSGVSAVTSEIKKLPGQVVSALSNLPGQMLSMGKNIIEGLLNGIESEAGHLLSEVAGLASKVAGAFASALTIKSPSLVMKEHGINTVLGAVVGVQEAGPTLINAMRQLGRTVATNGLGSPATGMASALGTTAGSAGTITAEWTGGSGADSQFITWLKSNIRLRGGDPGVLGR